MQEIDRRTFLKGVFVAAVTPTSAVRNLYSPKAETITAENIMNSAMSRIKNNGGWKVIACSTPTGTNHFYEILLNGNIPAIKHISNGEFFKSLDK